MDYLRLSFAMMAYGTLFGDEGLWTYNQFPREAVAKKYGIAVTDDFLDKLRLGSVRFNSGGSGSFVSANGLLFTNHHVAADCIQKVSGPGHDYLKEGFRAKTNAEEKACPDLEINVLMKIEEATARVKEGVAANAAPAEANAIRKANIAMIEKECAASTGLRCDVVTLYSGGRYDVYQYKKFTDVRLVFAPEFGIAFFGGDPDNFTYPRFNLDIAFLRAYENGKPASSPNFLRWSKTGAKEGELTFVSGHPGLTQRLAPLSQLEFIRDLQMPMTLRRLEGLMAALTEYAKLGAEQERQRNDLFFGASNSYKANTGFFGGLNDPSLMNRKREEEGKLKDTALSDPARKAKYGEVWNKVAASYAEAREFFKRYYAYEIAATGASELLYIARTLERLAAENAKPNGERLPEYSDAARPQLEQGLFTTAPIYPEMEAAVIAENLRFVAKELGADDPVVKALLGGKTPLEAAQAAVKSSKLIDVAERKRLAADPAALKSLENDGLLKLVRTLDGPAREYRKRWEDRVKAVEAMALPLLAQLRYELYGPAEYPDATFTLRLTYGPSIGYSDAKGRKIAWATDFAGLYKRATAKDPYILPASWIKARRALSPRTPFNFVTTCDIHGGNSGSPTVNAKGEVVGIVFDGNIESLPNRYVYTSAAARSVHVASQGIVEALRKVYGATEVLSELGY
ncbi:MAG: S46 family peptidase [Bryobacteraceae bacterium]|nr:S46 family peptidase [Bryobacteraceae bacterium]